MAHAPRVAKKETVARADQDSGRQIASSFWARGGATSREIQRLQHDLPRGRTYVRNGSVVDLQIACGKIKASWRVGSLCRDDRRQSLPAAKWEALRKAADVDRTLIDLLQVASTPRDGRLTKRDRPVPLPKEIRQVQLSDTPDVQATAAVLYGIGARLDREPNFSLRWRRRPSRTDGQHCFRHAGCIATSEPRSRRLISVRLRIELETRRRPRSRRRK